MKGYSKLCAVRLFDESRAAGYAGGYTQVKDLVRELRARPAPEAAVRFEVERSLLQPMACHPYRSMPGPAVGTLRARAGSAVGLPGVERRPLSSYAHLVHS